MQEFFLILAQISFKIHLKGEKFHLKITV